MKHNGKWWICEQVSLNWGNKACHVFRCYPVLLLSRRRCLLPNIIAHHVLSARQKGLRSRESLVLITCDGCFALWWIGKILGFSRSDQKCWFKSENQGVFNSSTRLKSSANPFISHAGEILLVELTMRIRELAMQAVTYYGGGIFRFDLIFGCAATWLSLS